MRKWVASIMLVLGFCFLVSCGYKAGSPQAESNTEQTVTLKNGAEVFIDTEKLGLEPILYVADYESATIESITYYRDCATDIMYMKMGNTVGFAVMLDPESGKGLTYDRWIELISAQESTTSN